MLVMCRSVGRQRLEQGVQVMHLQRCLPPTAHLTSCDCSAEGASRLARLHYYCCDQVFGRRAALLSGVCLAAMALIGTDGASAQEGPLIYVPNLSGRDVTIIDTPTNTVLPATIPV